MTPYPRSCVIHGHTTDTRSISSCSVFQINESCAFLLYWQVLFILCQYFFVCSCSCRHYYRIGLDTNANSGPTNVGSGNLGARRMALPSNAITQPPPQILTIHSRKAPATARPCPCMSFKAQVGGRPFSCPPASRIPPHTQIAALSAIMTAFVASFLLSLLPYFGPTQPIHPVQYLIYKLSVTFLSPPLFCPADPFDYGLAHISRQTQTMYRVV